MKRTKYSLLAGSLTILIFFIPFFWLRPGEMDLGGDNSRLYFYDPIAYLVSQSLYSVSHSGFGAENLSFYPIPFFLLLAVVKSLVQSPTILISIFHGLNLSGGFFFCYLVVKELLMGDTRTVTKNPFIVESSGIIAGLYYTFSQNPIGWWGYQLLPMNLVLVNPLMFYLLLRFFLTQRMIYLLVSILVTFVFSPNFSFIGAPTFFSFFPLAVLYLVIYTRGLLKIPLPIAKVAFGLVLFILIQSFHLIPQIVSIVTPGSFANEFIFGAKDKLEWGLKYFTATAPSIKVSYALLGLPQYVEPQYFWSIFVAFPILFILGLLWNKSRLYLLSVIFFLITLFFISANITHLGIKLYVLAFRLPGFAMFRVFYGQWQWAYLFFYTILLGLSLSTVLGRFRNVQRWCTIIALSAILFTTSWKFISGALTNTTLWQSKDVSSHVEMDPAYEEMLGFIRTLPVDGKILSLPLNDHGYQILKGKNDAAYVGPSTITYLAARNEFTSNAELGVYGPGLLTAIRDGNYAMARSILSALNIKYIFYNDDPYIYLDNFPSFPYTQVRNFFPDTQTGYKEFINTLGVKEVKTIAGKYHVYEFDDPSYIPHVYTADQRVYWNDVIAANIHTPLSFFQKGTRVALNDDINIFKKYKDIFDEMLLKATNASTVFDFFRKKKEDKFVSPTIARKLSSPIYPLVVTKEQRDLARYSTVNDAYIDRSIYFAEKRINELVRIEHIPLLGNIDSITDLKRTWNEPYLWEWRRYKEYNSWEITLARYQKAIEKLIDDLENANQSSYSTITEKVELKQYLMDHKSQLRSALRKETLWSTRERKYVSGLVEGLFTDLIVRLNLQLPDIYTIPYRLEYPVEDGTYEVYVHKNDMSNLAMTLSVDGKEVAQKESDSGEWMRFDDIAVQHTQSLPILVRIPIVPNAVETTRWKKPELMQSSIEEGPNDSITFTISYNFLADTSGLVRDISDWKEESVYAISFDYFTGNKDFSLVLYERGGTRTNQYINPTYKDTFKSKDWKTYATVVLSSKDARAAFLQFVRAQDDYDDLDHPSPKEFAIKNLSVRKIFNPRIVFKKIVKPITSSEPSITFTMVNPAKYTVQVRGATSPYSLVFSQEFNQRWKLFLSGPDHEAKTLKGAVGRLIGNFLKKLTKPIVGATPFNDARSVASYATGSIQEGKHTSILLDDRTFETWGQDPIAEATHLPVNGYANSWYIEPKDVGNRSDYTLVIEMTSQKLFYGSVLLAFTTLCGVIAAIVVSLIRIRKPGFGI